jgi:xylulose-5-phosphate/fructose-6-phosphate phosphoketolase
MTSNRLGAVFEVENRCFVGRTIDIDDHVSANGRVMEVLSEHLCEGMAGRISADRTPWPVRHLRSVRDDFGVDDRAARQVARGSQPAVVAGADRLAEHPADVDLLAQRSQRLQSPGPGLIDVVLSKRGTVSRVYLPPDANCLLSVADHCLRSRNYVNLIVIDKQPQLQWLDMDAAIAALRARARRSGTGRARQAVTRAGRRAGGRRRHTDAGDVAAAWWLRRARAGSARARRQRRRPHVAVPADVHPHGMPESRFVELFTADKPVVFAFHGYQRALHAIVHGRRRRPLPRPRLQRAGHHDDAVRHGGAERDEPLPPRAALIEQCQSAIDAAVDYARQHFEDPPEIQNWVWTD